MTLAAPPKPELDLDSLDDVAALLGPLPEPEEPAYSSEDIPDVPVWTPEGRDLGSEELWDLSRAGSRARRRAAEARRRMARMRRAGASLVVAALAAAVPAKGGSTRHTSAAAHSASTRLLHFGSRGSAVAAIQRALGIPADGIFGPQTRAAVVAFQREHGLVVDGIVGPQTRGALARERSGPAMFRARWVAPVQRVLGIPADGVFGPQTRAAVIAFQRKHGLIVDGIVGPQTLRALGLAGSGGSGPSGGGSRPTSSGSRALAALRAARAELGRPYAWGGAGPSSFDCSGLVMWSFRRAGISLPHSSQAMFGLGRDLRASHIRAGDLVFFDTAGPGPTHVGIALGRSTFISATTHGVRVQSTWDSYWGDHFVGARRIA